jgi:hypothetical protein
VGIGSRGGVEGFIDWGGLGIAFVEWGIIDVVEEVYETVGKRRDSGFEV